MQIQESDYNYTIILSDEKSLTVYFMLETRQRVNYDIFYNIFGATQRTFNRVIATLRRSLENASIYETQIIYNRRTQSFELIKMHFKTSMI